MVRLLGIAASMLSLFIWLPQVRHTWQHRNDPAEMSAISSTTQVLLIANNILWILYGSHIPNGFWIYASAIVNIPVGILTIFLINRPKVAAAISHTKAIARTALHVGLVPVTH